MMNSLFGQNSKQINHLGPIHPSNINFPFMNSSKINKINSNLNNYRKKNDHTSQYGNELMVNLL